MKDLSNKIKEFEKKIKVPHLKRTPKHEPTLSYFHRVECLLKCLMISGENNHHVHDRYGKEMAPSSDVHDTYEDKDEDESNNSIVHDLFDEPSEENIIIEESESECNIVNETSSQSDSSNVTTEFNYDDHIKTSANIKEESYFIIFECGRNLLDKLDVTYQSVFTASEKLSTPSSVLPAAAYLSSLQKKYWDAQTNLLTEKMAGMNKDKILDAIYQLKPEDEDYHEDKIG